MDSAPPLTGGPRAGVDALVRVAVVRSDNRRGALAQALTLIADDLRARVTPHVLVKPSLVGRRQLPSTHADALSAVLDAVFAAGARAVTVAEGGGGVDVLAAFERFGYRREAWGRSVTFVDLDREVAGCETVELVGADGSALSARVSPTVASAACRISLTVAETDPVTTVALGLGNLWAALHRSDRALVQGDAGNLVALAGRVRPHVSVVDGFVGVHRGAPYPLGTVVAGTDPVAVDAVATAIMGFDPRQVDTLVLAQAAGLGTADLAAITILGDPIDQVRGAFVSHSKEAIRRRAAHRPHIGAGQVGRVSVSSSRPPESG